jgi:hypothetical protein
MDDDGEMELLPGGMDKNRRRIGGAAARRTDSRAVQPASMINVSIAVCISTVGISRMEQRSWSADPQLCSCTHDHNYLDSFINPSSCTKPVYNSSALMTHLTKSNGHLHELNWRLKKKIQCWLPAINLLISWGVSTTHIVWCQPHHLLYSWFIEQFFLHSHHPLFPGHFLAAEGPWAGPMNDLLRESNSKRTVFCHSRSPPMMPFQHIGFTPSTCRLLLGCSQNMVLNYVFLWLKLCLMHIHIDQTFYKLCAVGGHLQVTVSFVVFFLYILWRKFLKG